MFDFFDQPWTLLITAAVALRIIYIIFSDVGRWWQWLLLVLAIVALALIDLFIRTDILRIDKPLYVTIHVIGVLVILLIFALAAVEAFSLKKRRWQFALLPFCIATAAFTCDWLVTTDREKVNNLVQTLMLAVEREEPDTIDSLISDEYSDPVHSTKEPLMRYCRRILSKPLVEKNKKMALTIEMSPPTATVMLVAMAKLDQTSPLYHRYFVPAASAKVQLNLKKYADGQWLIVSARVLEVNRQPITWTRIERQSRNYTEP